jgi:hypothetical protein
MQKRKDVSDVKRKEKDVIIPSARKFVTITRRPNLI